MTGKKAGGHALAGFFLDYFLPKSVQPPFARTCELVQANGTIEFRLVDRHISAMQRPFLHPPLDDVTLESLLYALADPVRLSIVCKLSAGNCPMNCSTAAPTRLPKSTQSHHYQVLREAGLIRSERRGTEVVNTLRCSEINAKFPGIIPAILAAVARGNGCLETGDVTIAIADRGPNE